MDERSLDGGGFAKEALIVCGLIAVQMVSGVYMVILNRVLTLGVSQLFLIIFGNLLNSLFLLPFAITLERKRWPTELRPTLMVQFVLIALGGVSGFQGLMMLGMERTTAAVASGMPNLSPGLIFLIAACLGLERFSVRSKFSRAKMLGTLVCVGGAVAMSFLQAPPPPPPPRPQLAASSQQQSPFLVLGVGAVVTAGTASTNNWTLGCFYILAAVVAISCSSVLQAATLMVFPAPFSLCVVTSLVAAVLTAPLRIIMEGKLFDSSDMGIGTVSFMLLGSMVMSLCAAFQAWCVKQKGPVLVSIFNPIQTVCSAFISAVVLRQVITLEGIGGMILMFAGLYIVLWAKKMEGCGDDNSTMRSHHDIEKPLLS